MKIRSSFFLGALALLLTLAVSCGGVAPATKGNQADPYAKMSQFVGYWLGTIKVGSTSLKLAINLKDDGAGSLKGTFDSPDQAVFDIPADRVTINGSDFEIYCKALDATFRATLSEDGKKLVGIFMQRGQNFPLTLEKLDAAPSRAKPQDPLPPFPYTASEVTIPNGDISLVGTLVKPTGDGPFKTVILITGSGAQNRDEELMGHRPFLVLADALARSGIASLRCDDRGFGKSTGKFDSATMADFATDATSMVKWLRESSGLAISSIGAIGHSEGGLIAPLIASSSSLDFIVLLAAPALPGFDIIISQSRAIMKASGISDSIISAMEVIYRDVYRTVMTEPDEQIAKARVRALWQSAGVPESSLDAEVAAVCNPWMKYFLGFDPRPYLRSLKVPALALFGTLDLQVLADINAPAMESALKASGNPKSKVIVFPGLNHLFQTATSGLPAEYVKIQETMSPVVLKTVSEWIAGL